MSAVCGDLRISGMGCPSLLTVGALKYFSVVEAAISPVLDGLWLVDWHCSTHHLKTIADCTFLVDEALFFLFFQTDNSLLKIASIILLMTGFNQFPPPPLFTVLSNHLATVVSNADTSMTQWKSSTSGWQKWQTKKLLSAHWHMNTHPLTHATLPNRCIVCGTKLFNSLNLSCFQPLLTCRYSMCSCNVLSL